MAKSVVGLSLSKCIADICKGNLRLEDVDKIITSGYFPNIEFPIHDNKGHIWSEFPEKAALVARQLWREGRIVSAFNNPALHQLGYSELGHLIKQGHWLDLEKGQQFTVDTQHTRHYSAQLDEGVDTICLGIWLDLLGAKGAFGKGNIVA